MAKHKLVCLELFHPTYFPRIRGDPPCKDVHVYHVQHHTLLVHHQKKKKTCSDKNLAPGLANAKKIRIRKEKKWTKNLKAPRKNIVGVSSMTLYFKKHCFF